MKLGSHFTVEQRMRLSLAGEQRRGIPKSDMTRAKMSAAMTGRIFSEETKAKLSIAEMGNKRALGHRHEVSAETRAKISITSKGRTHKGYSPSDEQKKKQSIMMMGNKYSLGFHPSEETKAKQSKAGWEGGPLMTWRRHDAKRRTLGYVYLNAPFVGCEGHHVDNEQVIHMPKVLHNGVGCFHRQSDGRGMANMNAIAYNYLFKQEVEALISKEKS